MEHEPFAKKVMLEGIKRRMQVPAHFLDPPQPFFGTDIFQAAFYELSHERERAPGSLFPIKERDVRDWADRAGYAGDLDFLAELSSHVRAMDAVWLEVTTAKMAAEKKKAESKASLEAARRTRHGRS